MNTFVSVLDSGKTGPAGALEFLARLSPNIYGVLKSVEDSLAVNDNHLGANLSVDIQIGHGVFPYGVTTTLTHVGYAWNTALVNLPITANSSGMTKIHAIVGYLDIADFDAVTEDNPGALKFKEVIGAGGGGAPTDATIQASVGASNAFLRLGNVTNVSGATLINGSDIEDTRRNYVVGNQPSTLPAFIVTGPFTATNDVALNYVKCPNGVTEITNLYFTVKTAPTGDDLVVEVYSIDQAHVVGQITIAAGDTEGSLDSLSNPLVDGDVLRLDCTNVGSIIPGSDGILQMHTNILT